MQSDENDHITTDPHNRSSMKKPPDITLKQQLSRLDDPTITITQSQPLLLLEQRQVVKHMLLVGDWTILAIYTPSERAFVKHRHKQSPVTKKQEIKQNNEEMDHVRFLAVYAIRSSMGQSACKISGLQEKSSQCGSMGNGKITVGEIRLLQKECRVQGIKEWLGLGDRGLENRGNRGDGNSSSGYRVDNGYSFTNSSNAHSSSVNDNNNITTYNHNQSTTIPSPLPPAPTHHFLLLSYTRILLYTITPDHSITLTKTFTTEFVIPYNIVLLQPPNADDFVLAFSGVDRGQTFWSGYWEIQQKRRAVYLVKEARGLVGGKEGNSSSVNQRWNGNSSKNSISSNNNSNSNYNSSGNNSASNNTNNNKLRRVKSAENIFTPSFTKPSHYTKPLPPHPIPTSPSSTTYQTQASEGRLEEYKEKVPVMFEGKGGRLWVSGGDSGSECGSVRTDRAVWNGQSTKNYNNRNNNNRSSNISTTTISYSHCLQLFPSLLLPQYSHPHHPALTHLHHFYLQTQQQQSTTPNHHLLFLIGYLNLVTLINVDKNQIVSKVVLQPERTITTMLQVDNLFGLATVVITLQSNKQSHNNNNKLIKVTVDIINQRKLGLGLEQIKVGLECGEAVVQVERLVTVGGVEQLLKRVRRGQDTESQMKDSFQVVMSLIGDRATGNGLPDRLQLGVGQDGIRESLRDDEFDCGHNKQYNQENQNKYDDHQLQRQHHQGTQPKTWLGINLKAVPYHVILLTSSNRILLYNHITTHTQPLYTQRLRSCSITCIRSSHLHHSQIQLRLSLLCQKTILPELICLQTSKSNVTLEQQLIKSQAIIQELKEIRLTDEK